MSATVPWGMLLGAGAGAVAAADGAAATGVAATADGVTTAEPARHSCAAKASAAAAARARRRGAMGTRAQSRSGGVKAPRGACGAGRGRTVQAGSANGVCRAGGGEGPACPPLLAAAATRLSVWSASRTTCEGVFDPCQLSKGAQGWSDGGDCLI